MPQLHVLGLAIPYKINGDIDSNINQMKESLHHVSVANIFYMSVFEEHVEYIVGIPVFIISTLVAYWIFKNHIIRKELSFLINDSIRLIDAKSNFKNKFDILFDKQKIDNLSLLVIEFFNTGNQTIKKEDFDGEIQIDLGQNISNNISVLSADITEGMPQNIAKSITGDGNNYNVVPWLLNPKDKFKVQFLVDFDDIRSLTIDIKARIAGIGDLKKIDHLSSNRLTSKILNKVIISFIIALVVSLISGSKLISELIEYLSLI